MNCDHETEKSRKRNREETDTDKNIKYYVATLAPALFFKGLLKYFMFLSAD